MKKSLTGLDRPFKINPSDLTANQSTWARKTTSYGAIRYVIMRRRHTNEQLYGIDMVIHPSTFHYITRRHIADRLRLLRYKLAIEIRT